MKKFLKLGLSSILLLSLTLSTGCTMLSARIKGGVLTHKSATGTITTQEQSQDPKDRSNLNTDSEKTVEVILPAGSIIQLDSPVVSSELGTNAPNRGSIILSSNTVYRATIKDKVVSTFGGAQKNVLGETIAKLSSMKWISWVGVVVFLGGLASLFYPPLKLIIASTTTSLAITVGGLILIILPVLVVGHEVLILGVIGGVIAIWFIAHRHGAATKEVDVLREFIDKNKDGIDDREQSTDSKVIIDKLAKVDQSATDTESKK